MTQRPDPPLPPRPWRASARGQAGRGRADRGETARSQPLSRDAIVDTALRILDREGIDAVSMRRIAQDLDTGPSSLYAHVANKDELLELMLDRISVAIEVPAPDPARWQDQLKQVGRDTYRVLTAHRDIARAALGNIPTSPNALRVSEGMLAIMLAGGLPPRIAAWAIDRMFLYINADAYESSLFTVKILASGKDLEEYFGEFIGQLRDFFAELPPERFPNIAAHADEMTSGDGDQRFEFGLDMLVDGLGRYVRHP